MNSVIGCFDEWIVSSSSLSGDGPCRHVAASSPITMDAISVLWLQDPAAVKNFVDLVTKGKLLERDAIFSLFNPRHRTQMVALFEVLYGAADYDSFFKVAVWARDRTNPRQFLYAFSVALLHREDSKGLTLPPAYEITPHMFLTTDVVRKAYQAKMMRVSGNITKNSLKRNG